MMDVLGRKAPWFDPLTCNHLHVGKLRAPQVLCLSAPVPFILPSFLRLGIGDTHLQSPI